MYKRQLLKAAPHAAVPLAAPVTEALGGEGGAPALSRQLALLVQQGVRIFDARRCNNPELIRELAQCFPLLPPLSPLEEPDLSLIHILIALAFERHGTGA